MKKDTYYFSHDGNAKDDPKIMILIDQLGLEAYGIFWVLIETLRTQPDYRCPLVILPSLARRYNTTAEKMMVVVTKYDLFVIENETIFFSESLNRRMALSDAKRIALSEAGKRGYQEKLKKLEVAKPPLSEDEATLKQLNEIKGKLNKKENKNDIEDRKLKFAYTLEPFLEKYGRPMINQFYKYWTEPNKSNTKFRQESQKTWSVELRLEKWFANDNNFKKTPVESNSNVYKGNFYKTTNGAPLKSSLTFSK